jgi:hypothetical protein
MRSPACFVGEGWLAYKTFPFIEDSPDFSAEFVILRRIGFLHYLL